MSPGGGGLLSGAGPGASVPSPAAGVEGALSCCGKRALGFVFWGSCKEGLQVCSLTGKRGLEALGPLATLLCLGCSSSFGGLGRSRYPP